MQVVDKLDEGLSRVFGVRVPATELGARLDARIAEIGPTLNLKGFRPGKVPQAHIRRIYGKALMGEVVEKTLNETSQQVLEDHKLRIAARPDLTPQSDMDQVLAGKEDLAYDLAVEIMPEFDPMDVSTLKLTRLVYAPAEAELQEGLAELAAQNRTFTKRAGKDIKARDGDQVVIDFAGTVDGAAFEGGAASDAEIVLGSGQFIPGFEPQLVGAAVGGEVAVTVIFPDDYPVEALRTKTAAFAVKVKEVRAPKAAVVDKSLAERLGMADLDALEAALRANLQRQYDSASRFKLKRALLDALDAAHPISLPPGMVEGEFQGIWRQVEHDKEHGHPSPEDEGKSEETLRAEYRKIAERRVRLGLVLAEIGRRAEVTITEQEMNDALRAEAMQYGAQAQQVFDMLRQNPDAQTQVRAPLYEEKVVDLILSRATVSDKAVSKEVLLAEDDMPPGFAAGKPAKAKSAKAKPRKAGHGEAAPAKQERAADATAAVGAPAAGRSGDKKQSGVEARATAETKRTAARGAPAKVPSDRGQRVSATRTKSGKA